METDVLTRVRTEFLPYALPDIGEDEIAEAVQTLKSGWITTGPKTKEFERRMGDYLGVNNAIAVNSCTAALHGPWPQSALAGATRSSPHR